MSATVGIRARATSVYRAAAMGAPQQMDAPEGDVEVIRACRAILGRGSKSFAAASRLLPARLRDPVACYYAFCRVSDDAVDESSDPRAALDALRGRLDRVYAGRPDAHPADRGLAWVVASHRVPRAPLDALLDGYLWDVEGRRYRDLSGVRAYSARVAASVGVVMTLLMGRREDYVLHRAADLGVAMQLTNIARDIGEDARAGRLYLPTAWLEAEGIEWVLVDNIHFDRACVGYPHTTASNLANVGQVASTPGEAYRTMKPVFRTAFDAASGMAMSMPKMPKSAPPANDAKRMVGVSMPVLLP